MLECACGNAAILPRAQTMIMIIARSMWLIL